ncbi:Methyltransferase domain-containing protein [Colletotrichum scovillei]|uniref:Methyltransferase domain-containing protein n=1 Tax=Colletotrichum scovillei TaxID=1209932 RepID=A0A9P7RJL7_9PEZI|nr:Methyltransferase domain-containing protein [Colletotrichum scovillei]KAG7077871.1 Methyltransferase domain-containing protein [Colletotrichum scovillei]KAG7085035.1 Methyltransferase domain-containing protein [Colletotrichum scovillei]
MADEPTPNLPAHRIPTDRDTNSPFWTSPLSRNTQNGSLLNTQRSQKIRSTNTSKKLIVNRKKAWNDCPYPWIGLWLFLKLQLRNNKEFDEAVRRTQRGEKLLDFGWAVGQDLRSLVHAGSPPQSLHGTDLTPSFSPAGKHLFNDPHTPIAFLRANALNPPLHLAEQLLHHNRKPRPALLQPTRPGNLRRLPASSTLGKTKQPNLRPHGGLDGRRGAEGGDAQGPDKGQRLYRHTEARLVAFWTRVAAQHWRRVRVETWVDEVPAFQLRGEEMERCEPVKNLMYSIRFEWGVMTGVRHASRLRKAQSYSPSCALTMRHLQV